MLSTNLRFIFIQLHTLARMFHEWPTATVDMAVLPGVLGCRTLRRTVQVRLGSNPAVPRDGCPVAKPSLRSRDCNSRNIRARPRNLKILRPAQRGTQDDSSSLRGACPACPERSLGELVEGLEMTGS